VGIYSIVISDSVLQVLDRLSANGHDLDLWSGDNHSQAFYSNL